MSDKLTHTWDKSTPVGKILLVRAWMRCTLRACKNFSTNSLYWSNLVCLLPNSRNHWFRLIHLFHHHLDPYFYIHLVYSFNSLSTFNLSNFDVHFMPIITSLLLCPNLLLQSASPLASPLGSGGVFNQLRNFFIGHSWL